MTASRTQEGYLVIADVSGYTAFLTGAELEHAQEIMEGLVKRILTRMGAPLRLVKLEGDAVFSWAPGTAYLDARLLIDQIEACYFDFAAHLRDRRRSIHCSCKGCSSALELDLKFFAHYGKFVVQRIAGTVADLAGPDIILVHRLLKNRVVEESGLKAYLLLTDACLARMGASPSLALRPHRESYEHLGEVGSGLHDLAAAFRAYEESHREIVRPEDADLVHQFDFPAPPAVVWDYFIDPSKMKVAEGLTEASSTPNENGRMGVGATQRCCHGEKVQILKFLDWRPFDYYTQAMRSERRALFPPHFVATFEFAPRDGGGTRLTGRFRLAERGALGRFVLWLLAPLVRWFMRRTHRRLARLLAEEGDNFRRDEVEAAPEPSQAAAPR